MPNKVLVAGASGLIGISAIEAFLDAGWEVVGVSRRKPNLPSGRPFEFISVNLWDEHAAEVALSALTDVSHVAYAAIYENADDLVGGWSNEDQIEVNNAMLRKLMFHFRSSALPLLVKFCFALSRRPATAFVWAKQKEMTSPDPFSLPAMSLNSSAATCRIRSRE